ncbi:PIG-L family deacetylase [Curtobacterium sp. 24E2]|nr:PIG-L family deacetylase [Curtobacterium sp. 24E2]
MSKASVTRPERVLFVHAHPDDETLSSGGTIATLLELGAEVTVLTATRGERGEMLTERLAPWPAMRSGSPRTARLRSTRRSRPSAARRTCGSAVAVRGPPTCRNAGTSTPACSGGPTAGRPPPTTPPSTR